MAAPEIFRLMPGFMTLADVQRALERPLQVELADDAYEAVERSHAVIRRKADEDAPVYGVNTGFGLLANTRIAKSDLERLQVNLVLSHSAGVGANLPDDVVRLILVLKVNCLARGYSGVSRGLVDQLLAFLRCGITPCIPAKGSVGASGDLAPLAHMAAALLGIGTVRVDEKEIPARDALARLGLEPLRLGPKEGLALLNGTQVSAALALKHGLEILDLLEAALITGALSVDAIRGSDAPFEARLQELRGQVGQSAAAATLRDLLHGSEIRKSHLVKDDRVQDPYSIRCQPQVMGAALDLVMTALGRLEREANAVTDNPIVFADTGDIVSGGNFHGEAVAMAADTLAIAAAEIGALAERRIALLIDPPLSGLPPFLVENSGLNSGFMIAQVTAAALASENKSLAHPASTDSLPTSANQEDHVSMATFAARRLRDLADNLAGIVAIELLAAAQGIDFHKPLRTGTRLRPVMSHLRKEVPFYDEDRYMAADIAKAKEMVVARRLQTLVAPYTPAHVYHTT